MTSDAVTIALDDGREVRARHRADLPQRGVYEVREGDELRFFRVRSGGVEVLEVTAIVKAALLDGLKRSKKRKRKRAKVRAHAAPVQRRRQDLVKKLLLQGRIGKHQAIAADEICMLHEAMRRGLDPTSLPLELGRVSGGSFREPVDRMTRAELTAFKLGQRTWANEMAALRLGRRGVSRLEVLLAMAVYTVWPRQVEGLFGLRHGTARDLLCDALRRYAEIARWQAEIVRLRKSA